MLIRYGSIVTKAWLISFIIWPFSLFGFDVLVPSPQPFRGYEFEGRVFNIEEYGFLHRFSFMPSDQWLSPWDEGIIASIGSVSSKEFYSLYHLKKDWNLSDNVVFEFRSERGEDFENRYSSSKFGFGYQWNKHWSVFALSELQAVKQNEDIQLEIRYQDDNGNQLRTAFVAVDTTFNKKQEESKEYSRQPYTYFLDFHWQWTERQSLAGYFNYNSPLTMRFLAPGIESDDVIRLEYENASAELNWRYLNTNNWRTHISLASEWGTRERFRQQGFGYFERDYQRVNIELRRLVNEQTDYWLGVRFIKFNEWDDQFLLVGETQSWHRREKMIYGGVRYSLTDHIALSPTVFVNKINNLEPIWGQVGRVKHWDQTLIKLNVPLRFYLENQITLILNTTFEIDQNNFGGLNLQLRVPF